jgi:hypothetical protein
MGSHKEIVFEDEVVELLKANGYVEGSSQNYNRELALYTSLDMKYCYVIIPHR